ncbi:MAG: hypothetical protein EBV17_00265 [Actinobacteria bacterium]|nr:hypothetical protein [Actinomycetota bacterium]
MVGELAKLRRNLRLGKRPCFVDTTEVGACHHRVAGEQRLAQCEGFLAQHRSEFVERRTFQRWRQGGGGKLDGARRRRLQYFGSASARNGHSRTDCHQGNRGAHRKAASRSSNHDVPQR